MIFRRFSRSFTSAFLLVASALSLHAAPHETAPKIETPQLVLQTGHDIDGQFAGVEAMQFSPDGRWLASGEGGNGASGGQLFVWNLQGQLWAREDEIPAVQALDWSGDNQFIAIADSDGARIFERKSAKFIAQTKFDDGNPETYDWAARIQCLSDGRAAIYFENAENPKVPNLVLWNWKSGEKTVLMREVDAPYGETMQLSPDERYLAVLGRNSISLFDLGAPNAPPRQLSHSFRDESGDETKWRAERLGWSPDSRFLCGFSDSHFGLWNVAAQKLEKFEFLTDYNSPTAFALGNDGKIVWQFKQSRGKEPQILERFDGAQKQVVGRQTSPFHGASEMSQALDSDAKNWVFAGIEGDLLWYNGADGRLARLTRNANQWSNAVSFSADGKRLCVGYGRRFFGGTSGELGIFNVENGEFLRSLDAHFDPSGTYQGVNDAQFSPDGRYLVSSGTAGDGNPSLRVFDARTLELHSNFELGSDLVCKMGFSSDGKSLAAGSVDGEVQLWKDFARRATGDTAPDWKVEIGAKNEQILVMSAAISPDKTLIVAGVDGNENDGAVVLDFATGKIKKRLTELKHAVYGIVFSPDGQIFWTGDAGGDILEWDAQTLVVRRALQKDGDFCGAMALSKDGRALFAARDSKIAQFSLPEGRLVREFASAKRTLNSLSLSGDGKWLAGGDESGEATLWNLQNGEKSVVFARLRFWRDAQGTLHTRTATHTPDGAVLLSPQSEKLALWRVGDALLTRAEMLQRGATSISESNVQSTLNR